MGSKHSLLMKPPTYIRYVLAKLSKFVKISTHTPPQIPFYRGFFENEKGAITSPCVIFFIYIYIYFLIKIFLLTLFTSKLFSKCVSCFMLRNLMRSWHLNTWKIKIWLSQEEKELSKKDFSFFQKWSLLHIQNKLGKM